MRCAEGQIEMNIDILDDVLGTVCIYVCMAVVWTTERVFRKDMRAMN